MGITPKYTMDAIKKYNEKFERVTVNFEKGTKERCEKLLGPKQFSRLVTSLVYEELDRLEQQQSEENTNDQQNSEKGTGKDFVSIFDTM